MSLRLIFQTRRLFAASCFVVLPAMLGPSAAFAALALKGSASARFVAHGPAGMTQAGTTTRVTLTDDGTMVTLTVALASLTTGNATSDRQIRSELETDKYRTASFAVKRESLKFLTKHGSADASASGSFTLHGTTKPGTFHYRETRKGTTYVVTATAVVNVDEFGVRRSSYLGITVKPNVDLSVSFNAVDR